MQPQSRANHPPRCAAATEFAGLGVDDCSKVVTPGFRKFCPVHSRLASRLWKRRERLEGGSYRQDWKDRDKVKAAAYSRTYRQRRRGGGA